MGYFNEALYSINLGEDEAVTLLEKYIKTVAESREEKVLAYKILDRIYNESTTSEDIEFFINLQESLNK